MEEKCLAKFPQFSLSSEKDHEVRQKDALAKQKMKIYADKRANAKPLPIQEGVMVLLRQEKKNKLSTPFEGIYSLYCVSEERKLKEPLTEEWLQGTPRILRAVHLQQKKQHKLHCQIRQMMQNYCC